MRELGRTGLCVSPVGFGCHRLEDQSLGQIYCDLIGSTVTQPEAPLFCEDADAHKAALELAISLGCNFATWVFQAISRSLIVWPWPQRSPT